MTSGARPGHPSFLPGPSVDRTTIEGWQRWCLTRESFVPASVLTAKEYAAKTPRQRKIHDLHRLATHSSLPILATPMSEMVAKVVQARVEDGAYCHKATTRPGVMVNGNGAQGKTETVCAALAGFEEEWLLVNNYLNPDAMPGTRDLVAPVAYVRCPVKATPISTCQRILDFYGEDYKGMRLEDLVRTVKTAITEHATKALVIDDITRLKLHREADQDVLDLIREMMSMPVTLILVGVGIPTSGLLREGRRDPKSGLWLIEPVKDRGRSPNEHAATQHERRFELVDLNPFHYGTSKQIAAWIEPPAGPGEAHSPAERHRRHAHRRRHARVPLRPHRWRRRHPRKARPARLPPRDRGRQRTDHQGPAPPVHCHPG